MSAVIIAAARTAVGSFGGALAKVPAPALGSAVIKEVLSSGADRHHKGRRDYYGQRAHGGPRAEPGAAGVHQGRASRDGAGDDY